MRIVQDVPPIWDEIDARFDVAGKPVIFAWGDIIYNPTNIDVPASLLAHEMMHGRRQGDDIVGWWRRYIDEPDFRLVEEIPAHQAEYLAMMQTAQNRNERRRQAKLIARRLSGPLYGRMITSARAMQILKDAA